jgi:hypothetical protein
MPTNQVKFKFVSLSQNVFVVFVSAGFRKGCGDGRVNGRLANAILSLLPRIVENSPLSLSLSLSFRIKNAKKH